MKCSDGETDIMLRFERSVPGSNPGQSTGVDRSVCSLICSILLIEKCDLIDQEM